MKNLFLSLFIGLNAASCIDPQSAAKDKAKLVSVMSDQIAQKFPSVDQMTIEEYLEKERGGEKIVLVDVREEKEQKVSMLPKAITKTEFEKQKSKYKDHTIIAYCTIGYRSSQFAKELKKQNYKTYNLKESLLGWAHRGKKFSRQGMETTKAHVYEKAWNFLPKGYEGVTD